jgi:tetratricopeptide (TPR) repeat protein
MSYYDLRTLGLSDGSTVDSFFSAIGDTQSQRDYVANRSLSTGIDRYSKQDYAGAVKEFKRAIAFTPSFDYLDKAYEYLAYSYLNQNNTTDAINTYKQIIKNNPSNDSAHLSLGNIYFRAGQYKEAEAEYSQAVRVNPASAANRYALGQVYMATGRNSEAENQFIRVTQITPRDPNAYDALGQSLRNQQQYSEAEVQFKKAISFDKKYTDGYLDLGMVYTDMKMGDKAQEQIDILSELDNDKASSLQDYMAKAADPKIKAVFNTGGFSLTADRNTIVSTIDNALNVPNGSKSFSLNFMFDKEMDPNSVQNPNNWVIQRATGQNPGGAYNFGLPTPITEVFPPSKPSAINYDESSHVAQVTFWITQNSFNNGTIDPSHIVFQFKGKDAYGNTMDPSADEYSSVSKIV